MTDVNLGLTSPAQGQGQTAASTDAVTDAKVNQAPEDWRSSLPPELRDHETLKAYAKPEDLVKAHVDLAAKEQGRGPAFALDKYQPKWPEGVNPTDLDKQTMTALLTTAAEHGLSQNQVDGLMTRLHENHRMVSEAQLAATKRMHDEGAAALRKDWGSDFDGRLDKVKTFAKTVLEKYPTVAEHLHSTGLDNHPDTIRFFDELRGMISEDSFVKGAGAAKEGVRRTPGGMPVLHFPSMEKR